MFWSGSMKVGMRGLRTSFVDKVTDAAVYGPGRYT
jgi:hypothetical protein